MKLAMPRRNFHQLVVDMMILSHVNDELVETTPLIA